MFVTLTFRNNIWVFLPQRTNRLQDFFHSSFLKVRKTAMKWDNTTQCTHRHQKCAHWMFLCIWIMFKGPCFCRRVEDLQSYKVSKTLILNRLTHCVCLFYNPLYLGLRQKSPINIFHVRVQVDGVMNLFMGSQGDSWYLQELLLVCLFHSEQSVSNWKCLKFNVFQQSVNVSVYHVSEITLW